MRVSSLKKLNMSTIKYLYLSRNKLSGNEGCLFVVIHIIASYCPIIFGAHCFFMDKLWFLAGLTIFYILIGFILLLFLENKLASRQIKINSLIVILCIGVMVIYSGIFMYLYYLHSASKVSVFYVSIPFSWFTIFICTGIMMWLPDKYNKEDILTK